MIDMQKAQQKGINIIDSTKQNNPLKSMLEQNFPDTLSEGEVNLKALAMLLGLDPHSNTQGYELTFTGKGLANTLYTTPTDFELSEEVERSKERESTQNSIIIGDNLDVLKILKSAYYEKIKMIYIDPPYNTKSENFIYPDDFRKDYKKILREVGLLTIDEEGNEVESKALQTFRNITGSRSHSGWLSFMLPRLKLARDLLKEDGVIFISIDDNEQANLKILCDEIFGEENTDIIIWRKSGVGRDGKMKNVSTFRKDHEYIVVCFKNITKLNRSFEIPNWVNSYDNPDNDPRGAYKPGSISRREDASDPNHKNFYSVISPSGKIFERQFDCSKEEFEKLNEDKRIYWGKNGDSVPSIKIFENEPRETNTSSLFDSNDMTTTKGTNDFGAIMNFSDAEFLIAKEMRPKPIALLKKLVHIGTNQNDIVLDFFAGTGTTAQAVMELNAEDGGNRRFILVQLPEEIKEDKNKTAYDFVKNELGKADPKISDITIERVNRAGEKLKSEGLVASSVDIGYRVYSLGEKARLSDEGSIIPHSANITPADIARNLALFAGKPLHIPLEEIVADKLFVCEDVLCVVGIDKEVEEKILEDKNRAIFIDGYGTYTLESFLNLNIPNDERVNVVY